MLIRLATLLSLAALAGFVGCSSDDVDPANIDAVKTDLDQPADENLLTDAERKYVWDIEHLGFVIEQTVYPKFKSACSTHDFAAIESFFAESFECSIPKSQSESAFVGDVVSESRFRQPDSNAAVDEATTNVDRAGFIAWLHSLRSEFGIDKQDCSVSLGLVRLFPTERLNLDGSWLTVWKLRLAGRKDNRPVEIEARIEFELARLGEQIATDSKWIKRGRVLKVVSVRSTQDLMRDATADSGIDQKRLHNNWDKDAQFIPNTGGVYLADYDQDGVIDLLIDDLKFGAALYRGLGNGKFKDVTKTAGLKVLAANESPLWTVSAWADLDGDGDEDLIVEDRVYENRGDGTFADVSKKCGLQLAPATGYALGDFDCDGKVDVYVCHSGKYRPGQEQRDKLSWIDDGLGIDNALWLNRGDWKFEDVTDLWNAGASGSSCFAAVCLDVNHDSRPDIFAINEFGRNALLINTPEGRFVETNVDHVFGGFSMGVTAEDINNDGRTDLYVANMYSKAGNRILANVDRKTYPVELYDKIVEGTTGSKLYSATTDNKFVDVDPELAVADVGWAYGPVCFDLDADGWLDIYATAGFKSVTRGKPDG